VFFIFVQIISAIGTINGTETTVLNKKRFEIMPRIVFLNEFNTSFILWYPLCRLVRTIGILGPLQLDLEPLHSNLESVHGPDGRLGAGGIVKADKAKAFALVGGAVNEDLGADNVAKGEEHLHELCISELLGQVVDEQVAPFRSTDGTS
jgi:hypothetical protein